MNGTRTFGTRLVLALALVSAWIPAAMYATPGVQASAGDAPSVEALPAAGEAELPQTALRDA